MCSAPSFRLDAEGWDERDKINSTKSRAFRDLEDRESGHLSSSDSPSPDYNDVTSDESRSKELDQWHQREVAELLGDLMPPMEVCRHGDPSLSPSRCIFLSMAGSWSTPSPCEWTTTARRRMLARRSTGQTLSSTTPADPRR